VRKPALDEQAEPAASPVALARHRS
jgi:hypothetical protein